MLKCCECERDIDIENIIYRCFDGTVCSNKCQINRCKKIEFKDKIFSKYACWGNTTSYLIEPNETTSIIQKSPSFVPIYVKSRSDLKKTISKYNLDNFINDNYPKDDINYYNYRNNILLNNDEGENIVLKNLGNLCIFDNSYIDCSYNFFYNGVSKIYNIMNNMI